MAIGIGEYGVNAMHCGINRRGFRISSYIYVGTLGEGQERRAKKMPSIPFLFCF
jgi:hypothetical protein